MSEKLDVSEVSVQVSVLMPMKLRQQLEMTSRMTGAPKAVIIRRALEAYFRSEGEKTKPGAKPMSTSEVKDHYAEQTKILQKQRRPKTKETRDYARKHRKR